MRPSSIHGAQLLRSQDVFPGALINYRYRIKKHLEAGSYGHGWEAVDTLDPELKHVFIKTMRGKSLHSINTSNIEYHIWVYYICFVYLSHL